MVTYKGIEYRTRTLLVDIDSQKDDIIEGIENPGRMQITIAATELERALLNDEYEAHDHQAWNIDNDIYYYVDDINAPAEEICATGLDEPMTLIEEL